MDAKTYAIFKKLSSGSADPVLQDKEVTITENGETTVEADSDYDGLSSVDITVAVPGPSGSIDIIANGTYDVTEKASAVVNVPSSGGVTAVSKGVNFIDYDGTIVAAWESSSVASKTSLPDYPSHDGLTAQGWNWTLSQIQSYIAMYPDSLVTVGQMYITSDGKTRIYIHLEEGRLSPYLGICPNGSVDIDWGDGTTHSTVTGTSLTSLKTVRHTYEDGGNYVILLTVSGTASIYGYSSSYYYTSRFLWKDETTSSKMNQNKVYSNAIQKIEIGNNITKFDAHAFTNCFSLKSITIPNSVTSMNTYAFYNCYSLTNITIPNGITSIGDETFSNCNSLTNITIPNGITSIGNSAFTSCYSLINITIPNSVTSIGTDAFYNCYSLTNITIPNSVTSIGTNTFYNCYSLKNASTPDFAAYSTFIECRSLSSVVITTNVSGIWREAFKNCFSLKSITIPNSVTSIGDSAFYSCYSLTNITIPNGVTSMGAYAFYNCYGLGSIIFESNTPPTAGSSLTFSGVSSDCIIYVPTGTLSAYKSATNYPDPSTYTYVEY